MLPNFLVIGAPKAGTSSLYHYLRSHPQVFMPARKELRFFIEEADYNWKYGLAWYEAQFAQVRDERAVGEATPNYAVFPRFPGVPERVAKYLPNVRLIYLVRHPIERMRSQYLELVFRGMERMSMVTALLKNPNYLNASQYALQIEQYLRWFPRERLLIVRSEDLRDERSATLRRIFSFLEIDDSYAPSSLANEFNKTSERRVLRPLFRTMTRWPRYQGVKRRLPDSVQALLRSVESRPLEGFAPRIPSDLYRTLSDMLRDDVRQLRVHLPSHFDGWGIA